MSRNTQVIRMLAERLWPLPKFTEEQIQPEDDAIDVTPAPTLETLHEALRIVGEVSDDGA